MRIPRRVRHLGMDSGRVAMAFSQKQKKQLFPREERLVPRRPLNLWEEF